MVNTKIEGLAYIQTTGLYKSALIAALLFYCAQGAAIEEGRNKSNHLDYSIAASSDFYCDVAIEDAAIEESR